MGLCKSSLMLGIYAAATNLRLLEAWASKVGLSEPPALASLAERNPVASAGNAAATGYGLTTKPPDS